MYRHALPPGFVLKKDKKKEEKEEEISLEELIENERAALGVNVTRITLETFLAWKKRKRQEKVGTLSLFHLFQCVWKTTKTFTKILDQG